MGDKFLNRFLTDYITNKYHSDFLLTANLPIIIIHGAASWSICFALLPADFGGERIVFG